MPQREPARQPEDLDRFFLERANAGDLEGVVALYEPAAVLSYPPDQLTVGHENIRRVYAPLLAAKIKFQGEVRPAIRNGDLALTSTSLPGNNATVEVARRQSDGTWLWAIDQPKVL
ncbi:MAG: nuclear transport factor 2 family protein [Thaumarchaeota archaeon]|nr:nuclear transport factor 2 family protein [Nitrososphaerota archaeon]